MSRAPRAPEEPKLASMQKTNPANGDGTSAMEIETRSYHQGPKGALVRVSLAVQKSRDQKQLGEERVSFSFHFHITVH